MLDCAWLHSDSQNSAFRATGPLRTGVAHSGLNGVQRGAGRGDSARLHSTYASAKRQGRAGRRFNLDRRNRPRLTRVSFVLNIARGAADHFR